VGFQSAEFSVAYFGSILIYIAIILYGTWIATGVAEEKGSRIMEIMVNAATPRDLLFGKVVGIMLAGLAQLVPMLVVAGTLFALQPRIAEAVDVQLSATMDIDLAQLSVKAVSTFLVYFLFGFILYGGLYAGIGSMVSRQEEVNQAVSPMMTIIVLAFFASIVVMNIPNSLLAKVLMIVPLTSPFVALPRILIGDPAGWEIALSVGLLIISAIGSMWIAGKLYRVGVLMYGQRPGWKSLFKIGGMQQVAR
jgi:ABC-2 type transport system permease protein